jgi:hypothetical protein
LIAREVSISIKVTNRLSTLQSLIVEPWLTEYALPSGKALTVTLTGDPKYPIEVETGPEHITIYAFDSAGATVSVLDNGKEAPHMVRPK